ncbi:hypothetical protein BGZ81_011443 [Podila clonocystis]|nr:hypothetical protein BGZ81_011443 [Podila clonocystis]
MPKRERAAGKHRLPINRFFKEQLHELWGDYQTFFYYRNKNLSASQTYDDEYCRALQVIIRSQTV